MHRRDFLNRSAQAVLAAGISAPFTQRREHRFTERSSETDIRTMISDIEKLVPGLMKEAQVPGFSIALIHDGKRVWSRGFGVRDSASQKPVDGNTVFECASVSKTVFAYAIMKLCEQGVLRLDAPLVTYKPEPVVNGDPRSAQITTRHILSHQSGLQNWRTPDEPLAIHFDPGTGFLYSGEGYYYLQSIVTHLKGKTDTTHCGQYEANVQVCATNIGEYLYKQVLAPLGMTSSRYLSDSALYNNYALPHEADGKIIAKSPQTATDLARYAAAGGLLTTANDYSTFIISLFEPKENDAFRLGRKSIEEMHRPQVKLPEGQKIDGADAWGLGWAIQQRPGGKVVIHSGGQTGYRSLTMVSMEKRSGFIMLSNSENGGRVVFHPELSNVLNRLLPA